MPFTETPTPPVAAPEGTIATIWVLFQLLALQAPPPLANATWPLALAVPKPEPAMVMLLPLPPLLGVRLVICGDATVNCTLLLPATPPEVTLTGPLEAVAGTVATIWVSDQLATLAFWTLKATVL